MTLTYKCQFTWGGIGTAHPPQNFLATALAMRGWNIPQHVEQSGNGDPGTYLQSDVKSCLDYWILSPAVPDIGLQTTTQHPGHRHLSVVIQVPRFQNRSPETIVCPHLRREFPEQPIATCCPTDWVRVQEHDEFLISIGHMDLAWHFWKAAAHESVAAHALNPPTRPRRGCLGARQRRKVTLGNSNIRHGA